MPKKRFQPGMREIKRTIPPAKRTSPKKREGRVLVKKMVKTCLMPFLSGAEFITILIYLIMF